MTEDLENLSVLGEEFEIEDDELLNALEDIEDQLQLTPEQLEQLGAKSASWLIFLEDKACKEEYLKRLHDFLLFHYNKSFEQPSMELNMMDYFQFNHDKKDEDGDPYYAPTTLRSWFSVFQAFYLHSGRGKLKEVAPIINIKLNQWVKEHEAKKAKTFTREDLIPLFQAQNTPETLLWKAYSAIALGCAARNCEMNKMTWESVSESRSSNNGELFFEVSFYRAKPNGPKIKMSANIKGDLEVQAIMEYRQCFSSEKRNGKFFKKLVTKEGIIQGNNVNIGKNMLKNYGKAIAKWMNKDDFNNYTGHCFRRTSATLAADHGLTLPQIKTLTGHKSDSVAQQYIDRSNVQLDLVNEAVSMAGNKRSRDEVDSSPQRKRVKQPQQASSSSSSRPLQSNQPRTQIDLNFAGAVINAPIYLDLKALEMMGTGAPAGGRKDKNNTEMDNEKENT